MNRDCPAWSSGEVQQEPWCGCWNWNIDGKCTLSSSHSDCFENQDFPLIPHAERAFTAKRYRYVKVEPELVEYSQDLQEEKARIHFRDCFVQSNKKLSEVLNSHVKMTDRCSLFVLPRKLAYILLPSLQWKFFCRTSNAGGYQLRDVHVAADWSAIIFVLPGRSTQGRTPNCLVWSFGRWNAVSSWNFRIEKFLRLIETYRCSKINGGLKGIALRGQHDQRID